jgi:hypothetical protein
VTNQPPGEGAAAPAAPASNRTQIIVLSVVSSVLILGVLALLIHFVTRDEAPTSGGLAIVNGTATAPPSPTTPDEDIEPPAQDDAAPRFTFFSAQTEVSCPPGGDEPEISFSWETANAVEVWFTPGDQDAVEADHAQVPLAGTQADLPEQHLFPCAQVEYVDYTLTLIGPGSERVSETFRVIDLNWNRGG